MSYTKQYDNIPLRYYTISNLSYSKMSSESNSHPYVIVVYKLSEYKYLVTDVYPGNDCSQEELDRCLQQYRWVQLHPVLFIAELRNSERYSIEDLVIEYMSKYGIDSTRSTVAPYNTPLLSDTQVNAIQKKITEYEQGQMPNRKTPSRQWNRICVNTSETNTRKVINTAYSPKTVIDSSLYHCSYD
jgi:hypothetical protein